MLITGHEKGSIVVWHNITQYYLTCLAQAVTITANNATNNTTTAITEKKSSKKEKKQEKNEKKRQIRTENVEFTATALPLCTTLHWHAHAGKGCSIVDIIYSEYVYILYILLIMYLCINFLSNFILIHLTTTTSELYLSDH